jgi:hypothetical protein
MLLWLLMLEQGNIWVLLSGVMYDIVCVSHGFTGGI